MWYWVVARLQLQAIGYPRSDATFRAFATVASRSEAAAWSVSVVYSSVSPYSNDVRTAGRDNLKPTKLKQQMQVRQLSI